MKTLLDAIKKYPQEFISTCRARAATTPSNENQINHQLFAVFIDEGDWEKVAEMLEEDYYRKPLEGVVYCLNRYSDLPLEECSRVVDIWNKGDLI